MKDYYSTMGDEYMERAEIIDRKIKSIRQNIRDEKLRATEIDDLKKRLNILDAMYYDCLFTGRMLRKRGADNEQKQMLQF